MLRVGEHDELRPHGEGGEDLEGFRKGAGFVAAEELADFGVDLDDLGVEARRRLPRCGCN